MFSNVYELFKHIFLAAPKRKSCPSYIWVRAVVWACGRGQTHTLTHTQTDTQTRVTTIYFALSTTHAKCN